VIHQHLSAAPFFPHRVGQVLAEGTEYQMPSRGIVMRHLAVNNTLGPPEIIAP
jgi:hypothetical protein